MRRKTRDFGRLKLIAFFILVAVLLPKFINARSTDELGAFSDGETGIKLCARINNGYEDALRFSVTSDQGFASDVIVAKDTCKTIETQAANYTIREYLPQEYELISVSGGTVSEDATSFVATTNGQYTVIYENTYSSKPYLHNFGYTGSNTTATAVGVHFDANGGTGSMDMQLFGLNAQQNLSANAFTRDGYSFAGWNTKADGTGDSYTDGQAMTFASAGEITLYAQWNERPKLVDAVVSQANDLGDYQIDFTRKAIVSDDIDTANGNGVNKYTENGQDVYYFRGEVNNNNVIWAGKCWKMVRTTATSGVKMIYNGEVDTVEDSSGSMVQTNACTATGEDTYITYNGANTFKFNDKAKSPADNGYMYGERIESTILETNTTAVFTFANSISRNGDIYTLSEESISGTWADKRQLAATKYHYFCANGATACDSTMIGYIFYFRNPSWIPYLNIAGYDDFDSAMAAMRANVNDSNAKSTIEAWFEAEDLDDYENDLEDAVFCNDRNYYSGALKGENSDGIVDIDGISSTQRHDNFHAAFGRIFVKDAQKSNYAPSLDCASKNDSFTKDDTVNGNGKLKHKVGLITADELLIAGVGYGIRNFKSYLFNGEYNIYSWAASPQYYQFTSGANAQWEAGESGGDIRTAKGLRPVVSLKSSMGYAEGGTGTATNPYVIISE